MGYHREPLSMSHQPAGPVAPARLVLIIGAAPMGERALSDCLGRRGIRCIFEPALECLAALQHQASFDAVVLNVGATPGALAPAMAHVRSSFNGRLLVVASGDDEVDEVDEIMALELGADDFVRAPVSARRLRAHLQAQLRQARFDMSPADTAPEAGSTPLAGWHIDAVYLRLERGARTIALTSLQVQLLHCLQRHAGRVVPRAELHERVCPGPSDMRARTIDVYVHRLRRRLAEGGAHEIRIVSVRGSGFMLQLGAPAGAVPAPPALRAVT
jgi:DNA-binding response OmpR family regulator